MTVLNLLNCLIVTYGVPFAVYRGTKLADYSAFGTVLWGGLAWFVATICQVFRIRSDGRAWVTGAEWLVALGSVATVIGPPWFVPLITTASPLRSPASIQMVFQATFLSEAAPVALVGGGDDPEAMAAAVAANFSIFGEVAKVHAHALSLGWGSLVRMWSPCNTRLTFCSRSVPFSFPF